MSIGLILPFASKIIDKVFPDKSQAEAAKLKLLEMQQNGELAEMAESSKIIQSEASSDHWLAANWRPITMLTFVFIIANNYILYPYLSLLFQNAPMLEIPPDMWQLLKIGLGGYVVGRSAEKISKNIKNGN